MSPPDESAWPDDHTAVLAHGNVSIWRDGWQGLRCRRLWLILSIALTIGFCSPSAPASALPPEGHAGDRSTLVALSADPGPKPRPEDYEDFVEYVLALLRWLYALNGGDPAELEKASLQHTAKLVVDIYQNGLTELARDNRELLSDSVVDLRLAASSPVLTPSQRDAVRDAAQAIDRALTSANEVGTEEIEAR